MWDCGWVPWCEGVLWNDQGSIRKVMTILLAGVRTHLHRHMQSTLPPRPSRGRSSKWDRTAGTLASANSIGNTEAHKRSTASHRVPRNMTDVLLIELGLWKLEVKTLPRDSMSRNHMQIRQLIDKSPAYRKSSIYSNKSPDELCKNRPVVQYTLVVRSILAKSAARQSPCLW